MALESRAGVSEVGNTILKGGRWRWVGCFHSSFPCCRPQEGAKSIELLAPRPSLPVNQAEFPSKTCRFSSFSRREQHSVNAVNGAIARFEVRVNHPGPVDVYMAEPVVDHHIPALKRGNPPLPQEFIGRLVAVDDMVEQHGG